MLVNKPLIVTLWGGPGTGKSTTAAGVFSKMKMDGINTEIVVEFAKELVHEEHQRKLDYQPYVSIKQLWRLERLKDVDVIVTDTHPLLGEIYSDLDPLFAQWLHEDYFRRNTLDIFLERSPARAYNPVGRQQNRNEAEQADHAIRALLIKYNILATYVEVDLEQHRHMDEIRQMVYAVIHERG